MSVRKTPIAREFTRRLRAARALGSANRITVKELREWARGYLGDWDGEVEGNPSLAERPHWDLWMMDGEQEDALFAVLCFWPSPRGLEFFCGTGGSFPVRRFCEHHAPEQPGELYEEMRQKFIVRQGRLRVNRAAAEEWLGRGW